MGIVPFVRRFRLAAWLPLGMALAGCGGATDSLPREAVSGTVTLDGRPLESASIAFDPEGGNAHPTAAGAVINNGAYSIARSDGPTPGRYRVAIFESGPSVPLAAGEAP